MLSDVRFAFRALLHNRTFALVAMLSIALGIGVNALMFSMADALLLRPLPVPSPSRVVNLRWQFHGRQPSGLSYPDYVDFRNKARSFSGLAAYSLRQVGFALDRHQLPEMKAGLMVSGNFFRTLAVSPQLGRAFRADEDAVPGRNPVIVLSDATWQNDFASQPDIVGRPVFVDGIEFKVIGVAPASFAGLDPYFRPAFFIPLMMSRRLAGDANYDWMSNRPDRRLMVKGRLRDGVSVATAAAESSVIGAGLARSYPDSNRDWTAVIRTEIQERMDQSGDWLLVTFMLGLAVVVLLIACANVANLILGRGLSRSREIAIRMALGAARWKVVRQLLTESLLISLVAGVAGLVLASLLRDSFMPWRIPAQIPIIVDARIDLRVYFYALLASIAAALVCGLVPALRATGPDVEPALRVGGTNTGPRSRFFGRNALVVAQVAGSLFLLIVGSQMYRAVSFLLTHSPGFRVDHVLTAGFDPTLARYDEAQTRDFYKRLLDRTRALPGAVSVAAAELLPISNHPDVRSVAPEGYRFPKGEDSEGVAANVVAGDYFSTLQIPILHGRGLEPADTADAPRVAVVNEAFAGKYFPNKDAVGARFRMGGATGPWVRVVGVAARSSYISLGEPPIPVAYLPWSQNYRPDMTLFVQTAGPSDTLAGPVREVVRSLDTNVPVFAMSTMEAYFHDRGVKLVVLLNALVGGMGLLGLLLALSGLYAVTAWSVARRTREIGIRIAVGADRGRVLAMVLKQGLKLSAIGVAIGLVPGFLLSRALTAGLKVPPFNVPTLIAVSLALLAMTAAGAYFPARRASRLDPIVVLKQE